MAPEQPDALASDPIGGDGARSGRRRSLWNSPFARRVGVQAIGIGAFFVVTLVYFSVAAPEFFSTSNFQNILESAAIVGVVALGQTMTIVAGGFDLSVSGVVPLSCVAYAMLVNAGMPTPAAVVMCLFIGAFVGLVNGLIVTRIHINPLITTLGTLSVTGGLAFTISNGLTQPFSDPNSSAGFLGNKDALGFSHYSELFVVLAAIAFFVMRYTVFGRRVYAVGGNREASRLAGIRVDRITNLVYVISGTCAATAGIIITTELLAGSATVGSTVALQSIAATVLGGAALSGGRGGIVGTLLGVLVLQNVANGLALMQVPSFYQQVATGAVLLLAVSFGQLRQALSDRALKARE